MSPVTDEQLAAFLDGAMDDREAAAFEARLAADPDLAARAENWAANDRRIAAALLPIADAPIAPELLARMGLADPIPATPLPQAVNDNSPWWRRHALPLGGALAAGLALVVMLSVRSAPPQHGLSYALETGASLQAVKLADGSSVTPTLTVRAADGRYCREFRRDAVVGLACRAPDGWRIEAQGAGSGPAGGDEFAVASGGNGGALDAAYGKLGASDPLSAAAESDLIARGWK